MQRSNRAYTITVSNKRARMKSMLAALITLSSQGLKIISVIL